MTPSRLVMSIEAAWFAILAITVVAVPVRVAAASESEESEQLRSWIGTCVDTLCQADSTMRASAAAALAACGPEHVPISLDVMSKRRVAATGWDAYCDAISNVPSGREIAEKLASQSAKWPRVATKRLERLCYEFRTDPERAKLPVDPARASAARTAREILVELRGRTVLDKADPLLRALRSAPDIDVAVLITELRRRPATAANLAAARVLPDVATSSDTRLLIHEFETGVDDVAPALTEIGTPDAITSLTRALERGNGSYRICESLEQIADEPRVRAAVLTWLCKHRRARPWFELAAVSRLAAKAVGLTDRDKVGEWAREEMKWNRRVHLEALHATLGEAGALHRLVAALRWASSTRRADRIERAATWAAAGRYLDRLLGVSWYRDSLGAMKSSRYSPRLIRRFEIELARIGSGRRWHAETRGYRDGTPVPRPR